MTDEELNRKFEEISRILADVAVSHQKADERMRGTDERMLRTDERMLSMDERMLRVDESMRRSDKRMGRAERILTLAIRAGRRERREWRERHAALVDAQMRTEAKMDRLAVAQANLTETQAHSDRRLDALIDIVREDRERKNGRPREDDARDGGAGKEG